MGYYVHNKYDKASIDGLSTTGAGHTLVDFYTDYETYKYLDTSKGFGKVYDTLEYVTPNEETGGGTGSDKGSHFNFASSIIIKHIQRGIVTSTDAVALSGFTNIDKMVCLINGGINATNSNTAGASAIILELSVNSLKLTLSNGGGHIKASYQVIEFC